ncbi:hypothetical protein Bpfe_015540 [Biomphalaria pfeifferi]|uniref:Ig-like domain-containing protein n=1 Tax=Biomphalaria pfeifferi TaxID=112525 RepID=A0AAD8F9G4_BIOPF|nr:hypothetical protein Bpfe_015540 [Biomphalaria pfeifferi]
MGIWLILLPVMVMHVTGESDYVTLDRFEVLESKSGCTKGLVSGQDSIMLTGTVRTNAPFRWQLFLERVGFEIQDSYYGPVCTVDVSMGNCFRRNNESLNTCFCEKSINGTWTIVLKWTVQASFNKASFYLWWGQKNFEKSDALSMQQDVIDGKKYSCISDNLIDVQALLGTESGSKPTVWVKGLSHWLFVSVCLLVCTWRSRPWNILNA